MFDVELKLLSQSDMNSDDKYYVEPYKVYMNLIWLTAWSDPARGRRGRRG